MASKLKFVVAGMANYLMPAAFFSKDIDRFLLRLTPQELKQAEERADYLNRMPCCTPAPEWGRIADFRFPWHTRERHTGYFFPLSAVLKHFNPELRFAYLFGDVTHEPATPTFVKSRPIGAANSVVLRLNAVRHFRFVESDPVPWTAKEPGLVGRNAVYNRKRISFLECWHGRERCNLGQINTDGGHPDLWLAPRMSIAEQLRYRFIACIEGNDVATNLKWVMSSNSLAVMPRPEFETWYMEGLLRPNEHYVEVAADYSDLMERMDHFLTHPAEAADILRCAHEWVARFTSPRVERATELLVARTYFRRSSQL
jgi:hypothetical protein